MFPLIFLPVLYMKELIEKFIPGFLLNFYHCSLSLAGAFLYRFPSRKLIVIGITGTSGKSTVVEMTSRIFEGAGFKVASLSSIKFKIGEREWENKLKMTMPGRMKIQRFLRQAKNANCKYAILEITSEGIKQYRHMFINFNTALLTNLSPEHIEAHGGFEKYRKAKKKLFQKTKGIHVVNLDDKNVGYFLKSPAEKKYGYGLEISNFSRFQRDNFQPIIAQNPQTSNQGASFFLNGIRFNLKLLGEFNIYNSLAAICVGLSQGVNLEICKRALEKIKGISGRMEIVIKKPFIVIVDYAHTPEALESVYKTVSGIRNGESKMICVLGSCGGGRDKWKRPILGELAADYCQEIIVTNEDPYDENPTEIIEQVAQKISGKVQKILDRKEAIKKALESANPGDIVVITGKGSEPWMCVKNGKKMPWDDRKIVREEELRKL